MNRRHSFRRRLLVSFLIVSLIPLILCSVVLLQVFRMRLTENARENAQLQLEQAIASADGIREDFRTAASALVRDETVIRALSGEPVDSTFVYDRLFKASGGMPPSVAFELYDAAGDLRFSTRNVTVPQRLPVRWGILNTARSTSGPVFAAPDTPSDECLYRGAVRIAAEDGKTAGYLVMCVGTAGFRRMFGTYGSHNDLLVLNRYWRAVYASQPSLLSLVPLLRMQLLSAGRVTGESEEFAYSAAFHEGTGLCLVLRRPEVFTHVTLRLMYSISAIGALVCAAGCVLVSLKLSRRLFRPIGRLHGAIAEVEHENLNVRIPDCGDDELGELASRFNDMVTSLKRSREDLIENERELNRAQIRLLQSQLNPHFLCNTLDSMKWMGKINRIPEIATMSASLADILRFCISPDEFVTLRKETEVLGRYIDIQVMRMSGSFAYVNDVPEELTDCIVPKMILQPLAENAILHGLEGMTGGQVRLTAVSIGRMLRISVSDNGRGLPGHPSGAYRDMAGELSKGRLGLYNVDTIIRRHYDDSCGLFLESPECGGTVVTVVLPEVREVERDAEGTDS